jgi:anti-anti-sigma regulatory factor
MTIVLQDICGTFAENKDQAREMREELIKPALAKKRVVILDFTGVDSSTQSFIHALISTFFQKRGEEALTLFQFKGCNKAVASLIGTVINYSLE